MEEKTKVAESAIKPSKGYVLVRPTGNEQPTSVVIDDNETPQRGIVVAVGPDTYHEGGQHVFEAPCKVGDTVIHSAFGFEQIRFMGEDYKLAPFSKVLAVIEGSNE